jgi:dTDP-4-amino-4,6-dideoxygalactose transaminase
MAGDFRYATGRTAVPWPAVGEPYVGQDVAELVKFLLQPAENEAAYAQAAARVEKAISSLAKVSTPAAKLTTGAQVTALEEEVAAFLGAKYTLFTSSWTAGSELAHCFAGLGPGDEVIVPALTFFATISYPLAAGAKVVIADVDPRTLNMDPADVTRKVTRRTKVIVPVHLGGYPVDMAPIMKLAKERGLTVFEDAAHAFGARYHGKMIGTVGHFGAFSFHEVKNVTSFGEGGILVTNLAYGKDFKKARFIGFDGSRPIRNWLYDVVAVKGKGGCFPGRMCPATEVQALGLRLQMQRLPQIIAARRAAAEYLTGRFADVPGLVPQLLDTPQVRSTHHLYLLQVEPELLGGDIQDLKAELAARGVTQIPHFAPLYKLRALRDLGYDTQKMQDSCPVAEEAFTRRFTHLPLYGLTREQLEYLASAVVESAEAVRERPRKGRKR